MGAALHDGRLPSAAPARPPMAALQDQLQALTAVLLSLPPDTYTARPSLTSGSVGGHVRHLLDHVAAFVAAPAAAVGLSYDQRARGTAVEHDPSEALREILRLQAALDRFSHLLLETPVAVTAMLSTRGDSVTAWSSMARELAFVVSHTIHHHAMIALLLDIQGVRLSDPRFGYAPATGG